MLHIWKSETKDIVVLQEGQVPADGVWNDITSISSWIGLTEKFQWSEAQMREQIELFYNKHKEEGDINEWNERWYQYYLNNQ